MKSYDSSRLWKMWRHKWNSEREKYKLFYSTILFCKIFSRSYEYTEIKIRKNKSLNNAIKVIYVALIYLLVIAQSIVVWKYCWPIQPDVQLQYISSVLLPIPTIIVLVTFAFSKLLDVKKYQETHSRHRKVQSLRQMEMICFLQDMEDYSNHSDGAHIKLFIKRILEIELKNVDIFCENMEQKETGLREGVELFATKAKN